MPTTKSAEKRVRQNEKRRRRNRAWKTRAREARKKVLEAIENEEDADTVRELEREAVRLLDRAAGKGVFHENKSARLKSRLQKKVNEYVS